MKTFTFALMAALYTAYSHAAVLDLGTITRDTATGLDWLDVTETRGLSYDQVAAEMGSGGAYEGWRYATVTELDQLIINFGYTAIKPVCFYGQVHCDSGIQSDSALIENMIRTLGDTQDDFLDEANAFEDVAPNGAGSVVGFLANYRSPGEHVVAAISDYELVDRDDGTPRGDAPDYVESIYFFRDSDVAQVITGSFLVQASPVPVPAAAWLFGSALLGLVGVSRKRFTS